MPDASSLPARSGLGLKPEHYGDILGQRPDIGFFEIHAENYMGDGGPSHAYLQAIRELYPLSLHGVGLSIGGVKPLDREHLRRLRRLVDTYRPQAFSEHLAWSSHDTGFLNDLLPLPYTHDAVRRVADHICEVQDHLGVRMLLENPATYVLFHDSELDEVDFLCRVAQASQCGLLLDINNVAVSAANHRMDPCGYLASFPMELVGEIHLAGYDETFDEAGARLLIDAHGSKVREDVWALYAFTIERCGPRPTLIEWDNDIPAFGTLVSEAGRAETVLSRHIPAARTAA